MVGLWLAIALGAAPGDVTLAAQSLQLVGVDRSLAEGLTAHLAQSFKRAHVLTPKDMITVLSVERQKELLGCSDQNSSCLAELGDALGATGILTGELLWGGRRLQLNLRVIDPRSGRVLASYAQEVASIDDAFDALEKGAAHIDDQLVPVDRRGAFALIPLGVGVASGAVGGVLLWLAAGLYHQLVVPDMPGSFTQDPSQAVARGQTFQTSGWVLVGVGVAGLAAALAVLLFVGRGQ
jgi:TolB-like protein